MKASLTNPRQKSQSQVSKSLNFDKHSLFLSLICEGSIACEICGDGVMPEEMDEHQTEKHGKGEEETKASEKDDQKPVENEESNEVTAQIEEKKEESGGGRKRKDKAKRV